MASLLIGLASQEGHEAEIKDGRQVEYTLAGKSRDHTDHYFISFYFQPEMKT